MAIWLPILAVLLLVGSFMWLKPSPRDQFLAKLRSRALAQGFSLGSLRVPDTSAHGRVNQRFQIVTLYQLPVQLSTSSGVILRCCEPPVKPVPICPTVGHGTNETG